MHIVVSCDPVIIGVLGDRTALAWIECLTRLHVMVSNVRAVSNAATQSYSRLPPMIAAINEGSSVRPDPIERKRPHALA